MAGTKHVDRRPTRFASGAPEIAPAPDLGSRTGSSPRVDTLDRSAPWVQLRSASVRGLRKTEGRRESEAGWSRPARVQEPR